jgi:thioesterase domain-containing protein
MSRPDLTAASFVANPFSIEPGARLYKTGDRARHRPDGAIEFLGRVDHQVKIRGFRIETDEIQAVLAQHPGVREAAVVAREDVPGDKRLVAYVAAATLPLSASDLRDFLAYRLPPYMIPSVFVVLAALPRNAHGKYDRDALPAPESDTEETPYTPPRTPLERELAEMWQELLGVERVGIHDDFFERGGHSLLATQFAAWVHGRFEVELPVRVFFDGPTVAQVAVTLDACRVHIDTRPWSPLVAIQPSGPRPPLFCVHAQGGGVIGLAPLARHLPSGQPFYGLQAAGLEDDRTPDDGVPEMAARYLTAIRDVQPQGPYALAGYSLGGVVAFEMAHQLRARGEEVSLLALIDTWWSVMRRPSLLDDHLDGGSADLLLALAQEMKRPLSEDGQGGRGQDERLLALLPRAQDAGIVPVPLGAADLRRYLAVIGAHRRAVLHYAPRVYAGPLTLFRSDSSRAGSSDPTLGWNDLTTGPLEILDVAASHQGMVLEPAVRTLADQLSACLERARKAGSP